MKEIIKGLFNDNDSLASFILFALWLIVVMVVFDVYFILNVLLGCAIGFGMVAVLSWVIGKIRKEKQ